MSVESQTAGKHDSVNPEVEIPDELERGVNADDKYLRDLVSQFQENFKKFSVRSEIIEAGPSI